MTIHDMTSATKDTTIDRAGKPGRVPQDYRKSKEAARLDEAATIAELVRQARAEGDELTGPGGLLKRITKMVLETALEEEMTEHLGHVKHRAPRGPQEPAEALPEGAEDERDLVGDGEPDDPRNVRNGSRPKTVLTDAVGKVTVQVPRDRAGQLRPVCSRVSGQALLQGCFGRCRWGCHEGHRR